MYEQILEQLKQFQARELSDQQLEAWILSHLQQILHSGDERGIDLANELDALFIQTGENLLSHEMLTNVINSVFVREASTVWVDRVSRTIKSFSEPTVRKQWEDPHVPHVVSGLTGVQIAA